MAVFARSLLLALWLVPAAGHAQSLLEFYRQALETNPVVKYREYGVAQNKAQEEQTGSYLRPQLFATGNYYWNNYSEIGLGSRRYDGSRTVLQARQALLDLSSYFKLQSSHFLVAQSEQERDAARMAMGGDVVDRYLEALQAADDITHLRAEKEEVESQIKRLVFMRERELVKVTDLYEAQAYYQGLLTKEIEALNARAVALERLRETTGLDAKGVAPLARTSFPAVPGRADQWASDAARNNPSLMALQNAIEAARKMVDSGRAQHVPKLDLTASRTSSDQGYDNRLTPAYKVDTVGVQLVIPLYEGGRVQGVTREATARFEMAREQHEATRRQIERDARTSYLSAIASYARISSTNEEVRSLEKLVDSQHKSYELGVTTILDLLIAQRRLYKARSDQSRARYDYIRDLTNLRVRAGALSLDNIEEIDGWMVHGGRTAGVQKSGMDQPPETVVR